MTGHQIRRVGNGERQDLDVLSPLPEGRSRRSPFPAFVPERPCCIKPINGLDDAESSCRLNPLSRPGLNSPGVPKFRSETRVGTGEKLLLPSPDTFLFQSLARIGAAPHISGMSSDSASEQPCVFISYSWTTPTHEEWVRQLAERLMNDGIDVRLDKWDLREGHDSNAFMESMITDPAVTKVLMICDRAYAAKADRRSGGVGTESQIISPELYGKTAQDKYAAIMTDEDEEGNPHVPVFYRGRIFFDFRSGDRHEESYEQLLRWLAGKPRFVKPKLGKLPDHIIDTRPAAIGTRSAHQRAIRAVEDGAPQGAAHVRSFGETLVSELSVLQPVMNGDIEIDEAILTTMASIRPYLHQLAELARTVTRYSKDIDTWERLLGILEQFLQLTYPVARSQSWHSWQFDAFKFAAHDAFMSTLAIALDEERFDLADRLFKRVWLVRNPFGAVSERATSDFAGFSQRIESLEHRNNRLRLNRRSLFADLVKEAHDGGALPSFESVMQADFVCHIRAATLGDYEYWYPETLVYASNRFTPFPIFARAESREFLDRVLQAIGATDLHAFTASLAKMQNERSGYGIFRNGGPSVSTLANLKHLGVRP